MGLMLIGLSALPLSTSLIAANTAQRIADLSQISQDIFDGFQLFRREQAFVGSDLKAEAPVASAERQTIDGLRVRSDAGITHAAKAIKNLDMPILVAPVTEIAQAYSAVKALRAKADRDLAIPKSNREQGVAEEFRRVAGIYLKALSAVSDIIDDMIFLHDPLLDQWIKIKIGAWNARNAFGERATTIAGALAEHRLLNGSEAKRLEEFESKITFSWQTVGDVVKRPETPASIRAAFLHAEEMYFGPGATLSVKVLADLRAGHIPEISSDALLKDLVVRNASIGEVASAAINEILKYSQARAAGARRTMFVAGAVLVISIFPVIAGLAIVTLRVSRPMVLLTQIMRRLADGDLSVAVPQARRGDELGEMTKAVGIFRENGLAMRRLEAEAAAQQRAAEAERAQAADQQAARAAQQEAVVEALAQGLERLAEGDLTGQLQQRFADEYERLRIDFNAALAGLHATVVSIAGRTQTIRTGTQEIAASSDDLSRRTEQQAAGLEQTAAALQQITATVRRTADGSQRARNVAEAAQQDAQRSKQVVRDAVTAMGAIEASAREIGKIIGVIDEIAFQTNLLALNAGVEAARAGESGRGFAVVASEVRALAQRSAEAAKEIKALVGNSAQQVERGVALVDETGQALARILTQVETIGQVIGDIAVSAQEQSTGLAEINTAVAEMDHVTQQNAAMVEQTTSATHSLAHETEELSRDTGRFRIDTSVADAGVKQPRNRHAA
jgi:methyl-accepting chemotaxis protein